MENRISNISFTARCPQIKEAQWACHMVDSKLPRQSFSKMRPLYSNLFDKNLDFLSKYMQKRGTAKEEKFLAHANKQQRRAVDTINAGNNLFKRVEGARRRYVLNSRDSLALSTLNQLEKTKLGNCAETARATAAVLKMNGRENVYTAQLANVCFPVDHEVCIFNRDGSKINGLVNLKKAIVVDPWAGVVDFADKALLTYKNACRRLLAIPEDAKLNLISPTKIEFKPNELEKAKTQFSYLLKEGSK